MFCSIDLYFSSIHLVSANWILQQTKWLRSNKCLKQSPKCSTRLSSFFASFSLSYVLQGVGEEEVDGEVDEEGDEEEEEGVSLAGEDRAVVVVVGGQDRHPHPDPLVP